MENDDLNSLWYYDLDPKYSPDSTGTPQRDCSPCPSCIKKQTELEQERSTNEELIRRLADITREKAALRNENLALKARLLNLEHGGGVAQPPPPEPGDSGGGVASTPSPSAHARALLCSPSPSSSGPMVGENGGPAAAPPSVKPKAGGFNEESAQPRSNDGCASSSGPDKTGSSAVDDRGVSKSSVAWRCECGGMDVVASETAIANGSGAGARRTAAALAVANLGPEGASHERIVCPVLKMTKHMPSETLAEVAKVVESVKRAQEVTPATASAKFAAAISLNSEGPVVGDRDANQMDVDNADGSGGLGQNAGRYSSKGGVMQATSRERPAAVETMTDTEENMRGKASECENSAAPSSSIAGPSLILSTSSSVGSTSMAGSVAGQSPASTAAGLESGREEAAARVPPATATSVTPSGGSYTPTTVTLSAKVAFVGGVTRRNIRSGEDSGYTPKEDDPFTTRHMHVLQCFLCGRFPTTQRDSRAVIFCSICPRKACLLCQETRISRDRSDWTQGKDTFGRFFEIPKCRACLKGVDDRIPPERLVGAEPLPPVTTEDMEESIGRFLDWLQNHDLAHFFVDDVDPQEYPEYPKKVTAPMNIGRMRKRLAAREYLGLGGDTQLMDDINMILTNCVLFNGELAAISRSAAIFKNRAEKYIRIHIKPIVERWLRQRGNGVNGSPPETLMETLERAPRDRINRSSSSPPPDNITSVGEATDASGVSSSKRKISSISSDVGDSSSSINSNVGKVGGGEGGRAALATSLSPPKGRRLRLMGSQPSGVLFSPGPAAISGVGSANAGSERGASKSVFDIDMDEGDEDAEWFDVRGSRAGIKTRGEGRAGSARGTRGRAGGVDLQIERALASEEVDGSGMSSTAAAAVAVATAAAAAAYRPRPSSGRANPYEEIADALKLVGLPTGSKRS